MVEKSVPYFPMFFRLSGRKVLVVGAGRIGSRRIEVLLSFGADVLAVAPKGHERMKALPAASEERERQESVSAASEERFTGRLTWERRRFCPSDLDGKFLAVAASDDPAVNDQIVRLCRSRGILVNHAGDQTQCDFFFPGVAREGNLVIGVCASGQNHGLVKEVSAALRSWLKGFLGKKESR